MRRRNARLTPQPQILLLNRVHFTASWLLWWWIFSALVNQSWWRKGLKPPIVSAPYPTLLGLNNNVAAVHAARQAVGWGGISLRCHAYRLQSSITEITAPCCHSLIPSLGSTRQFLMLSQGKWNEKDVTWEASSDLGVSLPAVIRNYLRIVGWSFIYASRDMMMSYLYNILLNGNCSFLLQGEIVAFGCANQMHVWSLSHESEMWNCLTKTDVSRINGLTSGRINREEFMQFGTKGPYQCRGPCSHKLCKQWQSFGHAPCGKWEDSALARRLDGESCYRRGAEAFLRCC